MPNARIAFLCEIRDDFGVVSASLQYRWRASGASEGKSGSVPLYPDAESSSSLEVKLKDEWSIAPLNLPVGARLSFHFEASDNDVVTGPKKGKSREFALRVVSEDELRENLLRREKERRQELQQVMDKQDKLLTESRALMASLASFEAMTADQRGQLRRLQSGQKLLAANLETIGRRLGRIIDEIRNSQLEEYGGPHQRRLQKEIIEPMSSLSWSAIPQALQHLDRTRRLGSDGPARDQSLKSTIAKQKEILSSMKKILSRMEQSEGFQEAINLLLKVERQQGEILDRTEKGKSEQIKNCSKKITAQLLNNERMNPR